MLVGLIIARTVALLSVNFLKGLRYRVPCQTKQGQLLHWPGKKNYLPLLHYNKNK